MRPRDRRRTVGRLALAAVPLLLLASGCAGTVAARRQSVPTAAVATGSELPNDVRWVAESAEYRAAVWQAFALAGELVEETAAGRAPGTWAVSVDADETLISNIQYTIEETARGADYDKEVWHRWVARRAATAIPGAREFLQRVRELGGRVVIVTNRWEEDRADTEANLRALELPYDLLLVRGADREKEPRWEAVEAGTAGLPPAEILLWVGDNIEDFPQLDQTVSERPVTELAPFGERFIVLPNPTYGSWER